MSNYFDSLASQWDQNSMKVERARVTAERMLGLNFEQNRRVLDFGSGTGLLGVQLHKDFDEVHLADASAGMLAQAQTKIEQAKIQNIYTHQVVNISQLPVTFSAIITLMTLHHIPQVEGFLADAFAALEDNGKLIIADLVAEDGSFHQHNPEFDGHNGFELAKLIATCERVGFSVNSAEPYFDILKTDSDGQKKAYPLFFLVAEKTQS